MSRFFAGSESESESSESEEEVMAPKIIAPTRTFDFSDDEEETKRVVRSAKDKRFDDLRSIIKTMVNHKKIKDMMSILTDFDNLTKAFDKAKKVVDAEGKPRFYLKCLVELEDFVSECWEDREGRKAMSKNNAKGLTTLRQKLRKYIRDAGHETDLKNYRENPDKEEEREDEEAESGDDDEGSTNFLKEASPAVKKGKVAKDADGDESDDSEFWGSDSEVSSSSDEDYGENLAAKFLKKTVTAEELEAKEVRQRERRERRAAQIQEQEEDDGAGWEKVHKGAPMEKPKMFAKDTEINHEAISKKLVEIISARGKKGTDRSEMLDLLLELQSIAAANNLGSAMDIKVMFSIIAAIFDYNSSIASSMKPEMWEKGIEKITLLINSLEENEDIIIGEHVADESENFETPPLRIRGCVLTLVERLDEEFTRMLQACDAHSTEYVERLKDEKIMCTIIGRVRAYMERVGTTEELNRIYLRWIEHYYYKFDHEFYLAEKKRAAGEVVEKSGEDTQETMNKLCKFIYAKDSTDRLRTRAMLCHIYHHALHDRWYEARNLMLMSNLQDNIQHSDVPTQILYNRTMVQLGLCAFRQGMIKDAHNCLVDIQSTGRAKELLAQGLLLQRQHERTPEQEKIEKRRQKPYHMHINLELLECVYLVSAMLMEIPYMAAHEFDARRRQISKNFYHVMRVSDRQALVGPPESMREHVVAASKAMKTGDWKKCKNYIINEKMNQKVWDLFIDSDDVRELIVRKIQEESLRTYLFTYSSVYDSLSLDTLADMFELEKATVHSIISKMIINEELMASLDEPTHAVIMHRTEPTHLQSLALQLSEKVSSLVDNNERMMEMKQGNFFAYQKGGDSNRGYQNRDGNRGYQNRDRGGYNNRGGRGGYQNRDDRQGGYQNRGGRGGYQNRDDRQGGYQGRGGGGRNYGDRSQNRRGGDWQTRSSRY